MIQEIRKRADLLESPAPLDDAASVFLGVPAIIVSGRMIRLMETVQRVARSGAAVLITGESGCGKEIVARAIHQYSMRAPRPWVDLSCAALPEHLLESELFGYEKGAFSGADSAKPGLFEMAHQGTIFLDEIGELDPKMQVKLLRVLDGVPYYRLGGVRKVTVDVRIVAATNRNLEAAAAKGEFRQDLYHRLNQINLWVPPLRERRDDIAPLARYFLSLHDPALRLSDEVIALLEAHSWPGNIRELRNVITRAAVLAPHREIRREDLPPMKASASTVPSMEAAATVSSTRLEGVEKQTILAALNATKGHQQKAAEQLGISRRTLSRKLKLYESDRFGTAL